MKKNLFTAVLMIAASIATVNAQTMPIFTVGFEELIATLDSGEVLNGSDGNSKYELKKADVGINFSLNLGWDTSFGGYWGRDFAISRKNYTTIEKSDFSKHFYCAKPGFGSENGNAGSVYAIGQNNSTILQKEKDQYLFGMNITNTTFAFNSMAIGDDFGRKFSYENRDSFILNIFAYSKGILQEEIRVILADFRSINPNEQFILDTWQYVGFKFNPDSISFKLLSSDNGGFGMNTPAYFAVDQIQIAYGVSTEKYKMNNLHIYPNPATSNFILPNALENGELSIFDITGKRVMHNPSISQLNVSIDNLQPGIYFVEVRHNVKGNFSTRLIKND